MAMANKVADLSAALIKHAIPKLKLFWYYARVELTPPKPGDIPQIKNDIVRLINGARKGTWKQLTVRQAWLNTLVATEVVCWFYVGECIGKRHLIGYKLN